MTETDNGMPRSQAWDDHSQTKSVAKMALSTYFVFQKGSGCVVSALGRDDEEPKMIGVKENMNKAKRFAEDDHHKRLQIFEKSNRQRRFCDQSL